MRLHYSSDNHWDEMRTLNNGHILVGDPAVGLEPYPGNEDDRLRLKSREVPLDQACWLGAETDQCPREENAGIRPGTRVFPGLPFSTTTISFPEKMLSRTAAKSLSSSSRLFSTSASRLTKVAVLGAGGGIGQPLSLLLKQDPLVTSLSLYDIRGAPGVAADVSHVDSASEVRKKITTSLHNA